MCGIAGIWEYSSNVQEDVLIQMRDRMTHRGPDDRGLKILDHGRLGLAHTRLSIIDLSQAGHQPMSGCREKDVWIVFNGEIYNHTHLRKELEGAGHKYSSYTDTETILHLYEEKGLDFIKDLEGDFAFALWDGKKEQLVLARDRLGVKPLYIYKKHQRLIFGSEIKAILAHPEVSAEINEDALTHYLSFLTAPAPGTLFQDIEKLPAGYMHIYDRLGVKSLRYWDAKPLPADSLHVEDVRKEILRLLRSSISKRMMSDVPFGVFLSGGVDSSANVALMAEQMTRPVKTFTVGFKDHAQYNELDSARSLARRFSTDHHEVIIDKGEMKEFLPELVYHQDEPIADPVCIPLYFVSKLAKESGTTVVQVGEGADEIFSGYSNYIKYLSLYENYWRHIERLPSSVRYISGSFLSPIVKRFSNRPLSVELVDRYRNSSPLFWGGAFVYGEELKRAVLTADFNRKRESSSVLVKDHLSMTGTDSDFLGSMIYLDLKVRLPELLLMRVDKITMATSVEARVPFLDHKLVEFALSIPRSLKVQGNVGKMVLKQALEGILPKNLLYSPKKGFGAPINEWLQGEAGADFSNQMLNSGLRRRGYFNYDFISGMFEEHQRGKRDWSFHLWALINLSLWYDRWIDKRY
jgi:asparagine synthase (glutamine-hydrolysing)